MGNVMKKGLMFLFILVIASLLFSNRSSASQASDSVSEIVEIIDSQDSSGVQNGYVEEEIEKDAGGNVFVRIVRTISNFFKLIVTSLFKVVTMIIAAFAG